MRGGVWIRLVGIRSRVHGREGNLGFVDDSALQALRLLQLRRERVSGPQRTREHRGRVPVEVVEVQRVQRDRFWRSGEHPRSKIQRNRIYTSIRPIVSAPFIDSSALSTDFGVHGDGERDDGRPDRLLFAQDEVELGWEQRPTSRLELSLRRCVYRGGWPGEHTRLPRSGARQKAAQRHQLLPFVSRGGRFTRQPVRHASRRDPWLLG